MDYIFCHSVVYSLLKDISWSSAKTTKCLHAWGTLETDGKIWNIWENCLKAGYVQLSLNYLLRNLAKTNDKIWGFVASPTYIICAVYVTNRQIVLVG